jgi:RimJ/RimL family protein N-acetyltransferase
MPALPLPAPTARLELREFASADFAAVHAYASDPEVVRYMAWGPNDEAATRAFLARARQGRRRRPREEWELAILERASGELVGGCGFYARRAAYREFEVGYCLRRASWRRGFGTEAVAALVAFAFESAGAHRLYATVDPVNAASRRLLERLGFRLEGHQRSDTLVRGAWRDSLVYALLAPEWVGEPPDSSALPSC